MISRKYLDLIVLSILNKFDNGLTGYGITKEINDTLGLTISPGTVYPKLKSLAQSEAVVKKENDYYITQKGKEIITSQIPQLIRKNTEFFPNFVRLLFKASPDVEKSSVFSKIPTGLNTAHFFDFENWITPSEFCTCSKLSDSIESLKVVKSKLQTLENRIEKESKRKLGRIRQKIDQIDQKI